MFQIALRVYSLLSCLTRSTLIWLLFWKHVALHLRHGFLKSVCYFPLSQATVRDAKVFQFISLMAIFFYILSSHSFEGFLFLPEACNFIKKRLWHRGFPVNFGKFLRTPFLQSTFWRLLLSVCFWRCWPSEETYSEPYQTSEHY